MARVVYYLSSIFNILRFRRVVRPKPDNWFGPYTTVRQAKEMREFIEKNSKKNDEPMKINRR